MLASRAPLRLTGSKSQQQFLLGAAPLAAGAFFSRVTSIAVHFPSLGIVGQVGLQSFAHHALLELVLQHRKTQFDAAEEIALHPVGAGQIDLVLSPGAEIEDARVLQKAPDDGAHAY